MLKLLLVLKWNHQFIFLEEEKLYYKPIQFPIAIENVHFEST